MSGTQDPSPIEHVGWDLTCACRSWNAQFRCRMVEAGYGWFAEARGSLLQHIGADGVSQTKLVALSGLTKQAVQQHLGDLERDGLILRQTDPLDARKNHVVLSALGHDAMRVAAGIKRGIEADLARHLGARELGQLRHLLRLVANLAR